MIDPVSVESPPRRRVLLTGATGGLGPVVAARLAETGASLALSALPEPELEELATRLAVDDDGSIAVAIPEDLRDPMAPARLVSAATEALGGIDVLVHNAGVESIGRFEIQSAESLEEVMRVNLLAAMELSRRVVSGMLERGRGRLLFMASMSGKTSPAFTGAYSVSKAGLLALARTLREEYRGTGVSATAVVPGFVGGAGMYERGRQAVGFRESRLLGTTTADRVARAVVRALDRDPPEVLVQRGPARLVTALAELLPGLVGERLNRWAGANRLFREWADARARAGSIGGAS